MPLRNALDELRGCGIKRLPSLDEIELAKGGSKWFGKKDGLRWVLIKHKNGSYNVGIYVEEQG